MSRLTTNDRTQPQQQPNQNQQIVQNIQQTVRSGQQQQQQFLTISQSQQGGSYLIVNNNNSTSGGGDVHRTPSNVNSNSTSVQGSIYYPTTVASSSSTGTPVVSQPNQSTSSSVNLNAIIQSNTTPQLQLPTSSTHPTSPIAKKRLKLDITESSSSGSTTEDLAALKKRIYEHKLQRLKSLKEK